MFQTERFKIQLSFNDSLNTTVFNVLLMITLTMCNIIILSLVFFFSPKTMFVPVVVIFCEVGFFFFFFLGGDCLLSLCKNVKMKEGKDV